MSKLQINSISPISLNSNQIQRPGLFLIFNSNFVAIQSKVLNTKVVTNILIYLKKKFHIFLRSLCVLPNFYGVQR
jgi:hypothetical protein